MTEKETHWEANDLINKGIYQIQLSIEAYKADLKHVVKGVTQIGMSEAGVIRAIEALRKEAEIFEYMQSLLDNAATEKTTIDQVEEYLTKSKNKKKL